ncbi:hypothetical protein DM01DRAFT_1336059 [Hesseltinella vesiculosa]|uniref:Glycosyl transferase family 28 C-terminal domain-containing protein n=1 Tax=Hesseltinella vesiculosa TaxID=101127 RepID=A0A1X2GGV0_9FUNG|nr:hypothetical protein DM01DRAFT_1336059 [Hesseltinella vesiculosa]
MAKPHLMLNQGTSRSFVFCFYVSGHGWGHATRANQIISDILRLPAQHQVYVISNASSFIFQGVIEVGAIYRQADIDAGVVQPLAYTVDRQQTIDNLKQFIQRRPQTLRKEIEWLKQVKADCVVCDAPFLPCAAAAGANIPAAIASNFTFDEVYQGLCEGDDLDKDIHDLVRLVIEDYRNADLLIRLPGAIRIPSFEDAEDLVPKTPIDASSRGIVNGKSHLPFVSDANVPSSRSESPTDDIDETIPTDDEPLKPKHQPLIANLENAKQRGLCRRFERRIVDVPLVFRKHRVARETVLADLGIPKPIYDSHKILLLSFGGQVLGKALWKEHNPLPPDWICIVCGAPDHVELPDLFYRASKDAYVPDLTNAADVVLGKLGYGTCSECISTATPFVYVPRPQFIEEYGLRKLMMDQGSAVELDRHDFEAGHWADAILQAAQLPGTCHEPTRLVGHDGGPVSARILERFVIEWNALTTNTPAMALLEKQPLPSLYANPVSPNPATYTKASG